MKHFLFFLLSSDLDLELFRVKRDLTMEFAHNAQIVHIGGESKAIS